MILWTIKLLSSVRKAIAGRKYPHQLAWAVAFGLLLGIVPHGNLLAIALLVMVLSLKINHAMAGLTAVAVTFLATLLDPWSHAVGDFVLTHPRLGEAAANAWQLPLVPWTDLNNTVVLGSFIIGVGALIPVFTLTYPVFRYMAPADSEDDLYEPAASTARPLGARTTDESKHQIVMVDSQHDRPSAPHHQAGKVESQRDASGAEGPVEFVEVDSSDESANSGQQIAVETRIDVIRMKDGQSGPQGSKPLSSGASEEQQPMDEALNYLLRQLRDTQQRKAA